MNLENIPQQPQKAEESYGDRPGYELAGRYVKQFLEARTEGRRLHSWDHTLFVADQALDTLKGYHKRENEKLSESDEFSIYIAALIHDVIQPNDIRNKELGVQMVEEWDFDKTGSEHSEGMKAFNYVVDELEEKLSTESVTSEAQEELIKKLKENRGNIIEIYSEKENKDLEELPWSERSLVSRSLSVADLNGNMNPDMVVKFGAYLSYTNLDKEDENKMSIDDAVGAWIKENEKFNTKPSGDAKPKNKFLYDFYNNPEIVSDWEEVAPSTMENFKGIQHHLSKLEKEKEILENNETLKKVCKEEGLGVYGMFSFWFDTAAVKPRSTSQEIFADYIEQFSQRPIVDDISKQYNLSEEDTVILENLEQDSTELIQDIQKWQKDLVEAEQSLGLKI